MIKKHNNAPVKINISSTQVLKTLSVLMEDNYTMPEIVQRLNENEEEPIFNSSIVSKYINTCRYCGIKIYKINNRYTIVNIPFLMDITPSENEILLSIKTEAQKKLSRNAYKNFEKFLEKLYRYSNKTFSANEFGVYDISRSYFEKAVIDKRKISIALKDKSKLKCIPVEVCEQNGKVYFHVIYNDKSKLILKDKITGVKILNDRCYLRNREENVIYKLTGKLASNYNTREHEKILENKLPEYVTVINHGESRAMLIPRLLRYGDLCEVISPANVRDEVKNIVNDALSNYGE